MSLVLTAFTATYLAPTCVAVFRHIRETKVVFLVNLLFGWTVVGWIAAMIWACTGAVDMQEVAARGDRPRPNGGLRLQGGDPRLDTLQTPPLRSERVP